MGVIELTDDRVKALGLKTDNGVEIKLVEDNSPAARAGLKVNDVIIEVNGKAVEDMEQFLRSIGEAAGGTKVTMTVWRGGAKRTLIATLESRQYNPSSASRKAQCLPCRRCRPVVCGTAIFRFRA